MTPGFVDTWPHTFHPLDGESREAVEVFQLRPDLVDQLVAWSGGELLVVNSGPAVLLPGETPVQTRLVSLGDFAVRLVDGSYRPEPADGFWRRYRPADDSSPTAKELATDDD